MRASDTLLAAALLLIAGTASATEWWEKPPYTKFATSRSGAFRADGEVRKERPPRWTKDICDRTIMSGWGW